VSAVAFDLPRASEATEPPEARGLGRDEVRMLVARQDAICHHRVHDLPDVLHPGDLLVVNTSATLPAAVPTADRRLVHVSAELDDGDWVVELRRVDNRGPSRTTGGRTVHLPGGLRLRVRAPHPAGQTRLWRVTPTARVDRVAYLLEHGRPISYSYVQGDWPLETRQNVYADVPGSAEMPSAGRPFSRRVLNALGAHGIAIASLTLHTGVSSLERGEAPYPERFRVPPETAAAVNAAQRVIAVGTTVVRALETAATPDGTVTPFEGWTRLTITPERGTSAVDGLLTGWHDPDASHLLMLEAIAGPDLVERSYATALEHGYRWHEFGDSHLLLP
jgi:S-adenosylmethionine:tRNA ribosyltransferase-isomerase